MRKCSQLPITRRRGMVYGCHDDICRGELLIPSSQEFDMAIIAIRLAVAPAVTRPRHGWPSRSE